MPRTLIATTPAKTLTQIKRELERDPPLHSPSSKRGYLTNLRAFETWRGQRPMTKLLVEQYAADLQKQGKAPNTINRAIAAIRVATSNGTETYAKRARGLTFPTRSAL